MAKLLAIVLFCAGIFCVAHGNAQVPMTGAGLPKPGAAAGYTGPGDCSGCAFNATAKAWWGLRCYSNAYSGNVADIVDGTTGNTTGTRLQCSSGIVSALVSGSACTFVTGNACSTLAITCATSCHVLTLYDQSGKNLCSSAACNVTEATVIDQPIFVPAGAANGCTTITNFCMTFSGGGITLANSTGFGAIAQPFFISGVFNRTGVVSFNCYVCDNAGSGFRSNNAANGILMYNGNNLATATANDNVFHAGQMVFDNAGSGSFGGSYAYIDGSTTSISLGGATGYVTGAVSIGSAGGALDAVTMTATEFGISAVAQSTAQSASLNSNQHTYWSF